MQIWALVALFLARPAHSQNVSGGSPPVGLQTERKVLLRIRYSFAGRQNPGVPEPFMVGVHYLHATAQWFGSGPGWQGSGTHRIDIDPTGRTRREGVREQDSYFGDKKSRRWNHTIQEGSFALPQGRYYFFGAASYDDGLGFTSRTSMLTDFRGIFDWATRSSQYSGGGRSSNVGTSASGTLWNYSSNTTIDSATGAATLTGDPEPTNIHQPWDLSWFSLGGGPATSRGPGNYRASSNGDGGSSSGTGILDGLYLPAAFMQDTASLLLPVPQVDIDRGQQDPAAEEQVRYAGMAGPYFSGFDGLAVVTHAQTWTEEQWRAQGPIWIGRRYLAEVSNYRAHLSSGQYWLESNDCEPFEMTWLEIRTPINMHGADYPIGVSSDIRDWTREPKITVRTAKLGKGAPKPEIFKIAPAADAENWDYSIVPVDIAVDADRDGLIEFEKDTTTSQKPFRYWINEDHDHGENDDDLTGAANHSDSIINGIRDLEDVTQVKFKIPQVLRDMVAAGTAQLGFQWKDVAQGSPSVRIWSGSPDIDQPDYLKDRDTALEVAEQNNSLTSGARLVSGASSVWLRDDLMEDATGDTVNLLMEGVSVGVGKLTLMIKIGTQESEGPGVDLKLLNVRQMYERGKITVDAPNIPNPWDNPNPPPLTWVWDPWNWQPDIDPNADKKTIAFVHGWRMPYNEYIQWADTTFKRFWQLGFKGRFYTFRWPTYHGQNDGISLADYTDTPGGFTYNPSEYRAWLSGPALANFVNGLPNGNARYLMAHSMGNVVAGSALRSNLQVTRYAMCNSAMAAMAYDSSIVDNQSYQTPDTDVDPNTRQAFGLADKLNPSATKIVSFGLGPDRALTAWDLNNQFFKPQTFTDTERYLYSSTNAPGSKLQYTWYVSDLYGQVARPVATLAEAVGYVTKSRSRAAGGKPNARGSIGSFVNMGDAPFEFGIEHSAQWNYSIQKTYPFWRRVAEEFNLDVVSR